MVVERERESALLNLLVQMDSIHGHLEQVGFRTLILGILRVLVVVEERSVCGF
jgi:hypothetical protein